MPLRLLCAERVQHLGSLGGCRGGQVGALQSAAEGRETVSTRHIDAMFATSETAVVIRASRAARATARVAAAARAPPRPVGPGLRGHAGGAFSASRSALKTWAEAAAPEAWQSAPDTRPLPLGGAGAEAPKDDGYEYVTAPVPYDWRWNGSAEPLKEMPPPPRGVADDVRLSNPLERLERLGTGWMGAIFEFEGVIVEDCAEEHRQAWLSLAEELGKSPPPAYMLKKAIGMKSAQVVSEVFCWGREPMAVREMATKKDEIFTKLLNGRPRMEQPGVRVFLETLKNTGVPCAIGCTDNAKAVEEALEATGLASFFEAVVSGEDVHRGRPDPECDLYCAQRLGRPPARCVVIGNSNGAVEAAREGGMKVVCVASRHAAFELSAADLVVRTVKDLTVMNLKNLFAREDEEERLREQMRADLGADDDYVDSEDEDDEEQEEDVSPWKPAEQSQLYDVLNEPPSRS